MEFYYFLSAFFLMYSIYTTIHILIATIFSSNKLVNTKSLTRPTHTLVLLPAYKPDADFPNRLSRMKTAFGSSKVSFFVVLQQSTEEMELQISELADYFTHISNPIVSKGNPYHAILQLSVSLAEAYKPSHLLLLDMDNEIDAISFHKLQANAIHFDVVQGKRVASSSNYTSTISQFDTLSESLNDSMMRASRSAFGAPIELSGSGFLIQFELFKQAVLQLDARAPGMDKNLLIQLLNIKPDLSMVFEKNALITDEKTTSSEAFDRQRTRWFGNQYFNARTQFFQLVTLAISSKRFGIFDYAISLCRPPRSFQVAVLALGSFIEILFYFIDISSVFVFLLSSIIYGVGLGLFLNQQRTNFEFSALFGMAFMGIKNSFLAIKSLSPSLKGTFLITRNSNKN